MSLAFARRRLLALGLVLPFALLAACTSGGPAEEPVAATRLAGSEWRPVTLYGRHIGPDTRAFVGFRDEGRLVGHGGCNDFSGSWTLDGDRLVIGPVAATKMACLADDAGLIENELFMAFDAVATVRRDDIVLFFYDGTGAQIATFAQTDWD